MDNKVREGYLDKVIFELRSKALTELGRSRWQELPKEKSTCKGPAAYKSIIIIRIN